MTVRIIRRGFDLERIGAWLLGLGFSAFFWWGFIELMGLVR